MNENIEEVFENREQIEFRAITKNFKSSSYWLHREFIEDKIYYRNPVKDSKLK